MLEQLTIDQIAIIAHSDIRFRPGYNVLTGETGAGKSILIDALGLVLGERADASHIRHGAERATVSATFTHLSPAICQPLAEDALDDPDNPGQIHIRRSLPPLAGPPNTPTGLATQPRRARRTPGPARLPA